MKSFEWCERLWRDEAKHQCMYALCLAMLGALIMQGWMKPKRDHIHTLQQRIERSTSAAVNAPDIPIPPIFRTDLNCAWDKKKSAWQLTGHFSTVYECLLQEDHTHSIASIRMQKHPMGVRVLLNLDENT